MECSSVLLGWWWWCSILLHDVEIFIRSGKYSRDTLPTYVTTIPELYVVHVYRCSVGDPICMDTGLLTKIGI